MLNVQLPQEAGLQDAGLQEAGPQEAGLQEAGPQAHHQSPHRPPPRPCFPPLGVAPGTRLHEPHHTRPLQGRLL